MRALFCVLLSFVCVANAWSVEANEKTYNKLNKLYSIDKSKCLEVSKKMIHKKKHTAIPYYFSSVIYYDKSKESTSLRGIYLQLNRAVRNAISFEKFSSVSDRNLVQWDEHIGVLKHRSQRLIVALNKNELSDLANNLVVSLTKVESLAETFQVANHTWDILDELLSEEKNEKNKNICGEKKTVFHGMPDGQERIPSANTNKEEQLREYINVERAKLGLYPLIWNEQLSNAARYHAYDQATEHYFSHSSKDEINGRHIVIGSAMDRIRSFYIGTPLGECLSVGNASAYNTLEQWLNSVGHAQIILDPQAIYIGIGFVYAQNSEHDFYWVLTTGM